MDMDMGSHSDSSTCVISMLWNWNTIDTCFISSSWHVRSRGAFAASCLGVLAMMFLLEFLRKTTRDFEASIITTFRSRAAAIRAASQRQGPWTRDISKICAEEIAETGDTSARMDKGQVESACCQPGGGGGCSPSAALDAPIAPATTANASIYIPAHTDNTSIKLRATALQQLIRSVLYMCTFTLAYFVMLLAMYYNGYLLICIFLGSGLAHFLINGFEMDVPMEGSRGVGPKVENRSGGALDEPTVCCG